MEPEDEDSDEIFKTLDLKTEMSKKKKYGKDSVLRLSNPSNSSFTNQQHNKSRSCCNKT